MFLNRFIFLFKTILKKINPFRYKSIKIKYYEKIILSKKIFFKI